MRTVAVLSDMQRKAKGLTNGHGEASSSAANEVIVMLSSVN